MVKWCACIYSTNAPIMTNVRPIITISLYQMDFVHLFCFSDSYRPQILNVLLLTLFSWIRQSLEKKQNLALLNH